MAHLAAMIAVKPNQYFGNREGQPLPRGKEIFGRLFYPIEIYLFIIDYDTTGQRIKRDKGVPRPSAQ